MKATADILGDLCAAMHSAGFGYTMPGQRELIRKALQEARDQAWLDGEKARGIAVAATRWLAADDEWNAAMDARDDVAGDLGGVARSAREEMEKAIRAFIPEKE